MGDLTAARVLNSSCTGATLPSLPTASLRVGNRAVFAKDHQFGSSRLGFEGCRNLSNASDLRRANQCRALLDDQRFPFGLRVREPETLGQDEEDLNIFDRLALAWRILFPTRKKVASNAEIAKQRLRMILISDRCSVNDNAKRKIVNNIVGALSDFVEIESQDRVQLNVSADPDLGTVYSVSVPVRRVRPEFQDNGNEVADVELSEDIDESEDARFDFPESQDVEAFNFSESQDVEA